MRKSVMSLGFACLLGIVGTARSDEKKMEMPKPGPEQQRLGYFVGDWTMEGVMKESPFGPGGKMTTTDHCTWHAGKFHIVCKSTGMGPMGEVAGLGIMGYNAEEKAYTYYGIDNMGMADGANGHVDGNSWLYTNTNKMMGKTIHGRYSMDTSKPDTYTFKWEISEDGKTYTTVMEGKNTRIKK